MRSTDWTGLARKPIDRRNKDIGAIADGETRGQLSAATLQEDGPYC